MGVPFHRMALGCMLLTGSLLAVGFGPPVFASQEEQAVRFDISSFVISGNTLFPGEDLRPIVKPFQGKGKTAEEVEGARSALEKYYHEKGYPTVVVNIPEQTADSGAIRLEVIETKIRRVRVTGNRYATMNKILEQLPSLTPGNVLYVPDVQKELAALNRNQDMKVAPVLIPGKETGTVDIELKVKDRLPVHGSVELNNRHSQDTSELRLNGMLRYDNLWQKDHSISLQYQTSPQEPSEVQTVSASYVLPAGWNHNQMIALYGLWSDSDSSFGEGFHTMGKGFIVGMRHIIPLPGLENIYHSLSLGIDYKKFDEDLAFVDDDGAAGDQKTPVRYTPLLANYNATFKGETGYTRFSAGLNFLMRNLAGNYDEFADKRYKAKGNYLVASSGLERRQDLPHDFGIVAKVDGQLASEPLISNEQYIGGGMASVRGYMESEVTGDDAVHGTVELLKDMDFLELKEGGHKITLSPFLFYDVAVLRTQEALAGQDSEITLQGTGGGLRLRLSDYLTCESALGMALEDTDETDSGDLAAYFTVKGKF